MNELERIQLRYELDRLKRSLGSLSTRASYEEFLLAEQVSNLADEVNNLVDVVRAVLGEEVKT